MKRRTLLATGAVALGAAAVGGLPAFAESPNPPRGINKLQTLIDDMLLPNEVILGKPDGTSPGRHYRGCNTMGNDPRGTGTPDYWRNILKDPDYGDSDYWTALSPWMYIEPTNENTATNTRVRLSQIRLNVLRKSSNTWQTVQIRTLEGALYPVHLMGNEVEVPSLRRNGRTIEVLPPTKAKDGLYHSWGRLVEYPTWDIKAVHIRLDAKLVVGEASLPDDRDKAQYLIHVGGDYYPNKDARVGDEKLMLRDESGEEYSYLPGIGLSRGKLVRNEWQTFNFTTLNEAHPEAAPGKGIDIAELEKNPPPLD